MDNVNKLKSTTVLAVEKDKDGKLVFAADKLMSWGMGKAQVCPRSKLRKRGKFVFAGTGQVSYIQQVADLMPIPTQPEGLDSTSFMIGYFREHVIKYLRSAGYIKEGESALSGNSSDSADVGKLKAIILTGYAGNLYEMSLGTDEISVVQVNLPYAHGCGGSYALGTLVTFRNNKEFKNLDIEKRLTMAIRTAGYISPGCNDIVEIIRES